RGGVLHLLSQGDPVQLDPARVQGAGGRDLARLVFRTLMTYDDKKGAAGSLVVPDLAQGPGTPSEGARTWTYQLQRGQRYADSSGPYQVRSYVRGRSLDLVRNTFWDPKSSRVIGAYPDEVVAELGLSAAAIDQRIAASTGPDATAVTDKARVAPQYLNADRTFR